MKTRSRGRTRKLTRAQLVQGLLMDLPTWYDPYRDRLSDLHGVIDALEAQARAWREDRNGFVAAGMRLWKTRSFAQVLWAIWADPICRKCKCCNGRQATGTALDGMGQQRKHRRKCPRPAAGRGRVFCGHAGSAQILFPRCPWCSMTRGSTMIQPSPAA